MSKNLLMIRKLLFGALTIVVVMYFAAMAIPINPDEQRPGTRLPGNLVTDTDVDWSFMQPRQKVYVQTNTWYGIPHSVTTVSFVIDGELYIPCGWCATKRWPKNVAADPDVLVKVGESLYPRRAVEVTESTIVQDMFARMDMGSEGVAVYRMDPR